MNQKSVIFTIRVLETIINGVNNKFFLKPKRKKGLKKEENKT